MHCYNQNGNPNIKTKERYISFLTNSLTYSKPMHVLVSGSYQKMQTPELCLRDYKKIVDIHVTQVTYNTIIWMEQHH